jgi:hypothetical protein
LQELEELLSSLTGVNELVTLSRQQITLAQSALDNCTPILESLQVSTMDLLGRAAAVANSGRAQEDHVEMFAAVFRLVSDAGILGEQVSKVLRDAKGAEAALSGFEALVAPTKTQAQLEEEAAIAALLDTRKRERELLLRAGGVN